MHKTFSNADVEMTETDMEKTKSPSKNTSRQARKIQKPE